MSQPFAVAQVFTGIEGRLVPLKETIDAFEEILEGKHDNISENSFYMVGGIAGEYLGLNGAWASRTALTHRRHQEAGGVCQAAGLSTSMSARKLLIGSSLG